MAVFLGLILFVFKRLLEIDILLRNRRHLSITPNPYRSRMMRRARSSPDDKWSTTIRCNIIRPTAATLIRKSHFAQQNRRIKCQCYKHSVKIL